MRNWTEIADQIEAQERMFLDAKKAGNRPLEKDMLAVMQAMLSVNRKTIMEALRAAPANPFGDAPATSYCTHAEANAAIASARPEALRTPEGGPEEKSRTIEELYSALQSDRQLQAALPSTTELQSALREATAIGIANLLAYCGAYESLSPHKRGQWDRLRLLAKLSDSPASVPSPLARRQEKT